MSSARRLYTNHSLALFAFHIRIPRSYFCLSRLLDGVQDNFTFAQKGIQRKVFALKRLTRKILPELCDHLDKLNIDFLHFAFRWMNCLLMRELNLECVLRLWDACVTHPCLYYFRV